MLNLVSVALLVSRIPCVKERRRVGMGLVLVTEDLVEERVRRMA